MHRHHAWLLVAAAAWSVDATAAITTTVVDLPTRGVTQRILYAQPEHPVANVVALPGDTGRFGILDDGSMPTRVATCNPVARNRAPLANAGYAIALVDMASDGGTYATEDIAAVVAYMRQRAEAPVWLIGGSNSTQGVFDNAIDLPAALPVGTVFFSPGFIETSRAAQFGRPSLMIVHPLDPTQLGSLLLPALANAPAVEVVSLGGGAFGGCGHHLFQGLDGPFVAAVTTFIGKHNASFPAAPAVAPVVEYYNAALDHYFLTHVPGEIDALDAGILIKGWTRTGQTFNVGTQPSTNSSPVCRYYIPPGQGDSHFYGRGTAECEATGSRNPTFVNEEAQFFHVQLPVAGECPPGTRPVYRVFSNRADANHRYLVDRALRDQMGSRGWLAEGDGPDLVVMCSPP